MATPNNTQPKTLNSIPLEHVDRAMNIILSGAGRSDGGCWVWTRAVDHGGYGKATFRMHPKRWSTGAHRLSYLVFRGDIGPGLQIDHLCHNRACVNPHHLEPVTPDENIRRATAARTASAACSRGHLRTEDNTYVRINAEGYVHRVCRECQSIRQIRRRAEAS